MSEGAGVKNLTARNSPDMLGEKNCMKQVPVRALKLQTTSKCAVFQGEAICDDGRSPKPFLGAKTASFRVDVFGRFLEDFLDAPNN